jgi:hypothetical protein
VVVFQLSGEGRVRPDSDLFFDNWEEDLLLDVVMMM